MSVSERSNDPRSDKGRRTRARFVEAGKVVFARDGFLKARIGEAVDQLMLLWANALGITRPEVVT